MKSLPSVMNHSFSQVPNAEIQRSSFDRSHGYKTTMNFGYLYPIFVDEVLPGDTFNVNMTTFARLATPIVPVMDNMFIDFFYFFVPCRLVWDNWQKFNGEQRNPGDSTSFLVPQVNSGEAPGFEENTIYDYLGVPTGIFSIGINAMPLRAYNLIWNEWFRDQNLQTSVANPVTDGPDNKTTYTLLKRGKRHDYFTSCLPWPQKGPSVPLPLGTTAPVLRTSNAPIWTSYISGTNTLNTTANAVNNNVSAQLNTAGTTISLNPNGGLYADLTAATAATINQLRQAFQIQRLYERDARGGTRYTEILKAHFGVTSPDARLQRPEYLGGGSQNININPVAQTAPTDDATTPQGNLAAYATSSGSGIGFTKSFTEHGYIIGLCASRADMNYQQGLNRLWSRQTRFDFYWPALAHIGEQAVLQKEIYLDGTGVDRDVVFGYQERYAEYRYKPSLVTGRFRSNASLSLDIWHLAQDFGAAPVLNATFIQEDPPIDRILAVPTEPAILFDSYTRMRCARPMPTYSVPGMIDHF